MFTPNIGVKILYPDYGAVHSRHGQRVQPGIVDFIGVDLDWEYRVFGQRQYRLDFASQILD
jgi:hypothetical protein